MVSQATDFSKKQVYKHVKEKKKSWSLGIAMSLQRNYQVDNLFFFNKNVTRLAEKENMGNVVNAFVINKVFNRAICNVFIVKMEKY